jgi:hypothetical protein
MDSKKLAKLIAATAAVAFVTAPLTSTLVHAKSVHCYGMNTCKGKGSCKTSENSCKGHNSCKGKGWVKASSEKKCNARGGSMEEPTTNTSGS